MADTSAQQSLGRESQEQQAGRGFESGQQPAPHATALQDYMNSAVEQTGKILKTMGQRVRSFADSVREEPGTQHPRARYYQGRVIWAHRGPSSSIVLGDYGYFMI
jgi:hypothetical protein